MKNNQEFKFGNRQSKIETDKIALVLGAKPVLRRRHPVCRCHDRFSDNVQTARHIEHGHRTLHQLALSAMGHQATLESACRDFRYKTALDLHHAACHRRGFRLCRPDYPRP